MGTAEGPLISGQRYEETILAGDQDWLGFCASEAGEIKITFENACNTEEGPNDIYAEIFPPPGGGEEHYLHPIPSQMESRFYDAVPDSPYFIHVYDLGESDIGSDVCAKLPWAIEVTGPLTSTVSG